MEINIKTKKKKVLKQLLNKTEKELKGMVEQVLDDWANNLITNKYQTHKTIDEIVDELDK